MAGGPFFGPPPTLNRALFFTVAIVATAGCSTHSYLYAPVPPDMIPPPLELPKVRAEEIPQCKAGQQPCMADGTYIKFAEMVGALKRQNAELRALLGAPDEP